jgi:hypothetical protein
MNCPICKGLLKPLFNGLYCPKDCDRPQLAAMGKVGAAIGAIPDPLPPIPSWHGAIVSLYKNSNDKVYSYPLMGDIIKFYLYNVNTNTSKWSDYSWKRIGMGNTEADFQRYDSISGKVLAGKYMLGSGNVNSQILPWFAIRK